jgi:hypothetical protein
MFISPFDKEAIYTRAAASATWVSGRWVCIFGKVRHHACVVHRLVSSQRVRDAKEQQCSCSCLCTRRSTLLIALFYLTEYSHYLSSDIVCTRFLCIVFLSVREPSLTHFLMLLADITMPSRSFGSADEREQLPQGRVPFSCPTERCDTTAGVLPDKGEVWLNSTGVRWMDLTRSSFLYAVIRPCFHSRHAVDETEIYCWKCSSKLEKHE